MNRRKAAKAASFACFADFHSAEAFTESGVSPNGPPRGKARRVADVIA